MADFAKCKGRSCPMKEKCIRFTNKASENQYYFDNTPYFHLDGKIYCNFFWGNKDDERLMKNGITQST